jgi:hypothetical protein
MSNRQSTITERESGLRVADLEDIWSQLEEFKRPVPKTLEEIESEREKELRRMDEERDRRELEQHEREAGYEFI